MGRLPVDHLPRRRRGRDRQPQREADDALLPRAGRGGQGEPARALRRSTARSSVVVGRPAGVRGAAAAHPPGREPGEAAGRADPGQLHRLRPAGPRRRGLHRSARSRERRAALEQALAGAGRRSTSPRPTTDHALAAQLVRPVRGRRPGRGDRQAARRHLRAGQAGRCSRSSTSAPRTASSPATASTRAAPDASARCCSGCTTTTATLASVGVIGAFPMARRKELFAELQPLVTTFDDHPWAWAKQEERHPDAAELPRAAGGTSARTCRSSRCGRSAWSRCATTTWRASGSGTPPSSTAGGRTGPAVVHLRAARGAGQVRPGRRPRLTSSADPGRPPYGIAVERSTGCSGQ